jgi:hypothetical protein
LKSTNGTALNGQLITHRQHKRVFQENEVAGTITPTPFVDLHRTMVLRATGHTPDGPTFTAKVLIVAGITYRVEYSFTKQMNVIGSQDGAAIWLTGLFALKSVATIARRGHSYSISPSHSSKSLRVNGTNVVGQ